MDHAITLPPRPPAASVVASRTGLLSRARTVAVSPFLDFREGSWRSGRDSNPSTPRSQTIDGTGLLAISAALSRSSQWQRIPSSPHRSPEIDPGRGNSEATLVFANQRISGGSSWWSSILSASSPRCVSRPSWPRSSTSPTASPRRSAPVSRWRLHWPWQTAWSGRSSGHHAGSGFRPRS
jgi:hypothetical protein